MLVRAIFDTRAVNNDDSHLGHFCQRSCVAGLNRCTMQRCIIPWPFVRRTGLA